jgi:hypothetical protein
LSIPQGQAIARRAKRLGISASEAIRSLIDEGLQCDFESMSPAERRIEQRTAWSDHSSVTSGANTRRYSSSCSNQRDWACNRKCN